MVKRIISLLLVSCMAVSILPMDTLAAVNGDNTATASKQKAQNASDAAKNRPAPNVNWHNESQNSVSSLTNEAIPKADMQQPQNTFTDVSNKDWFYDAVMYAKQNGIFGGTGNDTFSPDGTMTRAMYVTVLGRIAGVDASKYGTGVFKDVKAGMWYAPFVAWAVEKGITSGTGDESFSPDTTITREQMATLTVRYFESYKIAYETSGNTGESPKDISNISPWAVDAVLKLWHAGLFRGDSNGNFNPAFNATRAEAATFSMRTSELVKTGTSKNQQSPAPVNPTPVPPLATSTTSPASTGQPVNSGGGGGGGGSGSHSTTYTLSFNTNGGNQIDSQTLNEGTALNNLPTPYKMNAIFIGWYKDSGFSQAVSDSDTLTYNMTLYAKYANSPGVNETQSVPSTTKLDQAKGFTIAVDDLSGTMTADQVKAAMTFESPSNPDFAGIVVTGSGGHFTVAAQGGAFEEGATYKLTLNDKNLSFTGEDKSTTIYNFSIARQKVMNLGLKDGMVYVSASDVWDMTQNGNDVSSLSVPLATVSNSDTDLSKVDLKSGTFRYNGNDIKVGDTVAIYEGIRPDQRNLNTSDTDAGTVAYVKVTAINGDTYTYGNTDSKDVLFTPDILPVSNTADTDGNPNNHSITVDKSIMSYSDSKYAPMGLNANTAVDAGDFISFYTGTLGDESSTIAGYGKVTGVSSSGGNYIITYTDATQEQVTAAMDLYNQKYVDGDKLLGNTDVHALEAQIEQQAVASGFVDQASQYLAALAMDTDNFKQLNNDFDLKSYNVTRDDGTPISNDQVMLMGGLNVKIKNQTVNAKFSTNLQHFAGLSGVRCDLTVSCDIVISGEDNEVVIHLSAAFAQEVRIKLGVSGGAVWKWAWIFPYIADYRINANIDAYTYTGISINATIRSLEQVQDISKQIKDLIENKDKYNGMSTISGTLADKYSKMLETDSDWIDLVDKELYSMEYGVDPLHILVVGVKLDFVISAKVNVSIGCDFYYENAKRYIFSIGILSNTRSNDTVNLVEEHYQFDFYVMGTLGLRAGIRLELSAGLFSLKLDSIGFIVEAGAYVELWGYFYYELSYTASGGRKSNYSGALLLEVGIYLEIDFHAQILDDKIKYKPTLYENQWPLWSAGSRENVYDFSYSGDATPNVSMAKQATSFVLPNSTFSMNYMDMKTGKTDKKTYDDSKDFTITMTNSDFAYDPATNKVTVTPGSKVIDDGQMVVTWNGAPVAFTSTPISRTIPLHWENLKSTYSISFNSNGGSAVNTISVPYNTQVKAPANPQKTGYVFGGWYKDQNYTTPYTIPVTMPAEDNILYAKWTPAANTKYTVEHYQQNLVNDLYTLADTDSLTGTTNTNVSPLRKTYEGFTSPEAQSITIKDDGSTVLKYYYTRSSFTLSFNANGGTGGSTAQVKYGSAIGAPAVTKPGYTFVNWSSVVATTMPAQNTTYTAQWKVSSDIPYKVEHYQQNIKDNNYSLSEIEQLKGTTNTTATATAKNYTGFTYDSGISGTVSSGTIAADGSLTLKLYYTRKSFTLTFDANGGTGGSTTQVKYGAAIAAPTVTKSGYTFKNWTPGVASIMPSQDTTYTAQWTASTGTAYKVEHYKQNVNDNNYSLAETEQLQGTTNATATASAKTYTGFTYDSSVSGTVSSGTIASDGSLTLKLYYTCQSFTLTFDANGGTGGSTTQVKYGAAIAAPTVTKSGYTFVNWTPGTASTMPSQDTTYTAQWTESTVTAYKVEHYQQNVNDNNYSLAETEQLQGATNATATASAKNYTGFTYDSSVSGTVTTGTIASDGSLTLKLYYTRQSFTLTFDANGGTGGSTTQVKYGAAIAPPTVTKSGYTFVNWTPGTASTMPSQDTTYTAQWTESTGTAYKVEHYQQNVNDSNYSLAETEQLQGATNATATASAKNYTGFTYDSSVSGTVSSGTIASDGSLTLKLYYTRQSFTLTFDANGGTGGSTTQVKYGAAIAAPTVTKTGYTFVNWSPGAASTMPAQDTTYTAQWTEIGNEISTLSDLIAALADSSVTEVTVSQAIELTDGTTLNGQGKTVRAAITGIDESGSEQSGSDYNIFTIANGSTVSIQNLIIKGGSNSAITNSGTLSMNGVTITQSGSTASSGGGLNNSGKVVLKNCAITKNVAGFGAGFLNSGFNAVMTMDDSSVTLNNSMSGGGGGENNSSAALYLNNCTFSNNMSGEIGGAINNYMGTLYVMNSTITGNMSNTDFPGACGGGIGNNGGTLYVINSLLTNNFEQHSSFEAKPSDIGALSNENSIYLYNSYCGAYVTAVTDNLAVTGTPTNSTNSTVNPVDNGLTGIFGSYAQWNSLNCPVLVKQASGTYAAPLAAGSVAKTGGCDVYFDYTEDGVTVLAYDSTVYLIGSSGGTKITAYQGGDSRNQGVMGALGD